MPAGMEKTNSWYWRRMSRAAASGEEGGVGVEGAGNEKVRGRLLSVGVRDGWRVIIMTCIRNFGSLEGTAWRGTSPIGVELKRESEQIGTYVEVGIVDSLKNKKSNV